MSHDTQRSLQERHCERCRSPYAHMAKETMPGAREGIVVFECGSMYDTLDVGGLGSTIECSRRRDKVFADMVEAIAVTAPSRIKYKGSRGMRDLAVRIGVMSDD